MLMFWWRAEDRTHNVPLHKVREIIKYTPSEGPLKDQSAVYVEFDHRPSITLKHQDCGICTGKGALG